MRVPCETLRTGAQQELRDEQVSLIEWHLVPQYDSDVGPRQNGPSDVPDLEAALFEELLFARQTPVHEGRRSSYGAIILPNFAELDDLFSEDYGLGLVEVREGADMDGIRELASGTRTFALRNIYEPLGVAVLATSDEASLQRIAAGSGCNIVQRHPTGAIRVFDEERVLLFENDE